MIDGLILVVFSGIDLFFGFSEFRLFLLLLYPPYLFVRNYSTATVLSGGGFAGLLHELLQQQALGSYMLGMGLALFFFDIFRDVINWRHPFPQAVCLLGYFLIIVTTRLMLLRFFYGYWALPPLLSITLTYGIGLILIYYRFNRVDPGEGPSSAVDTHSFR